MIRPNLGLACGCVAALIAAATGCAPSGGVAEPLILDASAARQAELTGFGDLAVVLAAVVDDRGRIDPTALATQLPRLDRLLAMLAQPWPAAAKEAGSDVRLAWLYNARAAFSLRIVARERKLTGPGADRYVLPETIGQTRLLDSGFQMDGRFSSLRRIDDELGAMADFRIACTAPGATDLAGRLPGEPFDGDTVRSSVAERLNDYVCDDRRVVIDHARRRLRVPPALDRARPDVIRRHDERFGTVDAMLFTALQPYLNPRGRRRMAIATGYRAEARRGPAGIIVAAAGN